MIGLVNTLFDVAEKKNDVFLKMKWMIGLVNTLSYVTERKIEYFRKENG